MLARGIKTPFIAEWREMVPIWRKALPAISDMPIPMDSISACPSVYSSAHWQNFLRDPTDAVEVASEAGFVRDLHRGKEPIHLISLIKELRQIPYDALLPQHLQVRLRDESATSDDSDSSRRRISPRSVIEIAQKHGELGCIKQRACMQWMHERIAGFASVMVRAVVFCEYDSHGTARAIFEHVISTTPLAEVVDTSRMLADNSINNFEKFGEVMMEELALATIPTVDEPPEQSRTRWLDNASGTVTNTTTSSAVPSHTAGASSTSMSSDAAMRAHAVSTAGSYTAMIPVEHPGMPSPYRSRGGGGGGGGGECTESYGTSELHGEPEA